MVKYIKTCSRSVQLRILEEYVTAEWFVYVDHFCDHLLFVRMYTDQEQPPPAAPIATNVDASTGSNQAGAGAGSSSSSSSSSSLGENKRRTGWKGAGAARGGRSRRRNYNP